MNTLTLEEHHDLSFTSLCIYEEILNHLGVGAPDDNPWEVWRSEVGIFEVRTWCVDTAAAVNVAWDHCDSQGTAQDYCFDYEFVPLFLETCVEWLDRPLVKPDHAGIMANLLTLAR